MSPRCCRVWGQSRWVGGVVCLLALVVSGSGAGPKKDSKRSAPPLAASATAAEEKDSGGKVIKTDAEWRKLLTREQFEVARLKETEEPFTGAYWQTKKDGLYRCVCCGQTLFDSQAKFDSGTGWPSFWQPVEKDAVGYRVDNSEPEVRTEVICNRCDAHLGHVFSDGPAPTGLRFCMNSASLKRVNRDGTEETRKKPAKSSSKKKKQP